MISPGADSPRWVMTDVGRGREAVDSATCSEARRQLCDGLPLPAGISVVGYLAREPEGAQRA
jgi:hypothetical protein